MNRYLYFKQHRGKPTYLVYAGDADTLDHLEAILSRRYADSRLTYISRPEAIRLGWTLPRSVEKLGQPVHGRFADGGCGPLQDLKTAIEMAVQAAKWTIELSSQWEVAVEANIMFR